MQEQGNASLPTHPSLAAVYPDTFNFLQLLAKFFSETHNFKTIFKIVGMLSINDTKVHTEILKISLFAFEEKNHREF